MHMDKPLNFSTQEINIAMIQSPYKLQDLRAILLRGECLPSEVQGVEDALLLLLALLTDAIYLQRSLSRWSGHPDPINPFVPLSPRTEHQRMLSVLSVALDKWAQSFASIDPDEMVLYHYCRLYFILPEVTGLPGSVGYPETIKTTRPDVNITETVTKCAWQILDTAAASSSQRATTSPLWLPVVVFHAALVIWTDIANCTSVYAPSKRVLVPFILELQRMGWPCCAKMASTLETLMA
jgi:hypothetical protein